LAAAGVDFRIVPSAVPEVPEEGERPEAFARRVAGEKALDVARRHPGAIVLAADTVVAVDDTIFGKPLDRADARRMLAALSGRTHLVWTAVVVVDGAGRVEDLVIGTEVEFATLSAAQIENYVDSGEPFDKAGAYAVQGLASTFVTALRGSRTNVIGLPMEATLPLLERHGVSARR